MTEKLRTGRACRLTFLSAKKLMRAKSELAAFLRQEEAERVLADLSDGAGPLVSKRTAEKTEAIRRMNFAAAIHYGD
jgi:hypothetical protein